MLRIISDIHCKVNDYLKIIEGCEYTLQLGDLCLESYNFLSKVDSNRHKFIKGNHDQHDLNPPHCLPKYGYVEHGGISFFHMQGAFSLDWKERVQRDALYNTKSWWFNEQLSYTDLEAAIKLYKEIKPDIVITHEAPRSAANIIGAPHILRQFGFNPDTFTTHTSEALQIMFEYYQPKKWKFAHYHKDEKFILDKTEFSCMKELGYEDLY